jgi:hypothetical protein
MKTGLQQRLHAVEGSEVAVAIVRLLEVMVSSGMGEGEDVRGCNATKGGVVGLAKDGHGLNVHRRGVDV